SRVRTRTFPRSPSTGPRCRTRSRKRAPAQAPRRRSRRAQAPISARTTRRSSRRVEVDADTTSSRKYRADGLRCCVDDDVRLLAGGAEGRGEAENVALRHGAADDPILEQRRGDAYAGLLRRVKEDAVIAVLDELDRRQQPFAAHLADMAVGAHGVRQRL